MTARSIPARIVRWLAHRLGRLAKHLLLALFYRRGVEDCHYRQPLGLLLGATLFQRGLGVNGDAPWPVNYTSRVMSPHKIQMGRGTAVSFLASGGCYIQATNGIELGSDVLFAPGVKIISADHDPDDLARHVPAPPIVIGDHCWIGANAVILPGIVLGEGTVVGAGAVVSRSFPACSLVGGVPARTLKPAP